jgi:hypothetical protein
MSQSCSQAFPLSKNNFVVRGWLHPWASQSCEQAFPPSKLTGALWQLYRSVSLNPASRPSPLQTCLLVYMNPATKLFQSCRQAFPLSKCMCGPIELTLLLSLNPASRPSPLQTSSTTCGHLSRSHLNPARRPSPLQTYLCGHSTSDIHFVSILLAGPPLFKRHGRSDFSGGFCGSQPCLQALPSSNSGNSRIYSRYRSRLNPACRPSLFKLLLAKRATESSRGLNPACRPSPLQTR